MKSTLLIAMSLLVLGVTSCDKPIYRRVEGATWGTWYHITYCNDRSLDDSITSIMNQVNMSLSTFEPTSVLSLVNTNVSDSVDWMFTDVYEVAHKVYELSNGTFDPTVGPIVNIWGFGNLGERPEPDSAAIAEVLVYVGMNKTSIHDGRIVKPENTQFDFAALAKGYGVDLIGGMFERNGCQNYLIEVGGDLVAHGVNSEGNPWRIQVEAPGDYTVDSTLIFELHDRAVATSGNYRNYRTRPDGSTYGHTLDPLTGYPHQCAWLSTTVTAPTCVEADALATAFMTMNRDEIIEAIGNMPGVEFLGITVPEHPDSLPQVVYLP